MLDSTINYSPFSPEATAQAMNVSEGQHIAYLTPLDSPLADPATLADMASGTDRAYEFYMSVTGREPAASPQTIDNLATIAILPITPAAEAMGYISAMGVELQPYAGQWLYDDVRGGMFNQLPLYELGRNFWFYSDQMDGLTDNPINPMENGFASVNQWLSAEAAHLTIAPVDNPGPGWGVTLDQMSSLLDHYLADPNASWEGLLGGGGYDPISVAGLDFQATEGNLAGSFMYRIEQDHGLQAYSDFWHELGMLGPSSTPDQAKDNFLTAAFEATGEDYGWLFKEAGTVGTIPTLPVVTASTSAPLQHEDWNALAAQAEANFAATGHWFI